MTIFTDELLKSFDASITDVSTACTLPAEIYTSEEFLNWEKKTLFRQEWLCVGRVDRIPNPGDYFTTTLVDEPLIVARDKAGNVNCFSSVCQHRAMQICDDSGNCGTFTCPYHMWVYGLDGRLLGAPAMEKTKDFDKKQWGMPTFKVELWHGFIMVNLDNNAAPFAPTMKRYEPFLANYELENTYCPETIVLKDLPWNWKIMLENFNDGYHANRLHHTIQDFCPSSMAAFPVPWEDDSGVIFRTNGYIHIDGGFNATTKALMPVFPKLTEEERTRSTFALMPPNLCFGTAPDQTFFFIVHPKTPHTIDVEIGYMFHPSALEHPMYQYLLEMSDAGVRVFVQQDQDATTKVQRGLRSPSAPRGRYSWQEESHVQFNRWIVERYRKNWPGRHLKVVSEKAS